MSINKKKIDIGKLKSMDRYRYIIYEQCIWINVNYKILSSLVYQTSIFVNLIFIINLKLKFILFMSCHRIRLSCNLCIAGATKILVCFSVKN